jgi:hypothetical protein
MKQFTDNFLMVYAEYLFERINKNLSCSMYFMLNYIATVDELERRRIIWFGPLSRAHTT